MVRKRMVAEHHARRVLAVTVDGPFKPQRHFPQVGDLFVLCNELLELGFTLIGFVERHVQDVGD
ncbi:MAG: hypothetical protein BWX80_02007 [Candidatus Hydrogenedentes bacterium ADurb.Bin101]|nr:MAG: hypothetical protein BWX80_02007 [Candidatus Hydrogenedentes bacterium ADurb.Bin101]